MRCRTLCAALAGAGLLCGAATTARADVVHLRNGQTIEGRAVVRGDEVEVALRLGKIRLKQREVLSIERKPTPEESLASSLKGADLDDPRVLKDAAGEAERLGLGDRARELRIAALDRGLERRIAALDPSDAAGFVALAEWAKGEGASRTTRRYLIERALRTDPGSGWAKGALTAIEAEEAAEVRERERRARAAEEAETARLRAEIARQRAELARERERLELARREAEVARARAEAEAGTLVLGMGTSYGGFRRSGNRYGGYVSAGACRTGTIIVAPPSHHGVHGGVSHSGGAHVGGTRGGGPHFGGQRGGRH